VTTLQDRPRVLRAYLDDISLGGLHLHSEDRVDINEKIAFKMKAPLSFFPLAGTGVVRHAAPTKRHGHSCYCLGVEFIHTNKRRIWGIISANIGSRGKRLLLLRQWKEEAKFLFVCVPVIFLLTWFVVGQAMQSQISTQKERSYNEHLRKGVLHFLYHST